MRCINFENSVVKIVFLRTNLSFGEVIRKFIGGDSRIIHQSICHYLFLPILKVLAFFLQPGPRDSLIQCYIKRDRSTQAYLLYLSLNQGELLKILFASSVLFLSLLLV